MPNSVIAAQLSTLRDYTKTPADIAQTLKKVKTLRAVRANRERSGRMTLGSDRTDGYRTIVK